MSLPWGSQWPPMQGFPTPDETLNTSPGPNTCSPLWSPGAVPRVHSAFCLAGVSPLPLFWTSEKPGCPCIASQSSQQGGEWMVPGQLTHSPPLSYYLTGRGRRWRTNGVGGMFLLQRSTSPASTTQFDQLEGASVQILIAAPVGLSLSRMQRLHGPCPSLTRPLAVDWQDHLFLPRGTSE